ncbi:MAG: serine protease, partial [Micromonospora sp.]
MYRWTDPIDPDGTPRRPEPPSDEPPAWLTDRPEPRSSYLFGDEPHEPVDAWRDRPTERWRPDRTGELPFPVSPLERRDDHPGEPALDATVRQPADLTAYRAAQAEAPTESGGGRHRQPSRFPRPLLIGGAAAAATLVASLGVGALMLPGSDQQADRTSADDAVAAAPALPGTGSAPADAVAPASP